MAASSSDMSASPAAQLQTDSSLPGPPTQPEPHLDADIHLPLLSSLSSTANSDVSLHDIPKPGQRDYTLPRTRQPSRTYFSSHLPRFPRSPYKHPSKHDSASTQSHAPSSSSSSLCPAPPLPPCPTGPDEAAAWGCCCSLSGGASPLSRYLGKVGQAALPLLKVGELLNTEPSDVQT
ncbi:hypothetical protein CRENBAI_002152 [Crenichthys baileyi]|uniref:Uncharacterized protein n=1 Tax=Crenichthys baileyi TaxID=28760 RepID=A0AAV9RKN3_9TELE